MLLYLIGGDTSTWTREDYSQRQSNRQDGSCRLTNTMTGARTECKSAGGASGKVGAWPEAKVSTQWLPGGGWTTRCKARPQRVANKTTSGTPRPQNCRGCTNQLCWRDCSYSHVVRSNRLLEGRSPDQSPIDIYECPESGFCSWFHTSYGYSNHETTWTHSRSFKSDVEPSCSVVWPPLRETRRPKSPRARTHSPNPVYCLPHPTSSTISIFIFYKEPCYLYKCIRTKSKHLYLLHNH